MAQIIELELEVDVKAPDLDALAAGYRWQGEDTFEGLRIDVRSLDGHGFGLTEVLTIAVTIGTGVATSLVTDAIKVAVKGTIRRARAKGETATSEDSPGQTLAQAIEEAVRRYDEAQNGETPPQ